jgi:hypothetical protein
MHIVLGLIVAFFIVALYARRKKATRHCRWREDRSEDGAGLSRLYRCAACGATEVTNTGRPPQRCAARRA